MTYSLTCSCGKQISVVASQAGSEVKCGCATRVPPLSKLRQSLHLRNRTVPKFQKPRKWGAIPWCKFRCE